VCKYPDIVIVFKSYAGIFAHMGILLQSNYLHNIYADYSLSGQLFMIQVMNQVVSLNMLLLLAIVPVSLTLVLK